MIITLQFLILFGAFFFRSHVFVLMFFIIHGFLHFAESKTTEKLHKLFEVKRENKKIHLQK